MGTCIYQSLLFNCMCLLLGFEVMGKAGRESSSAVQLILCAKSLQLCLALCDPMNHTPRLLCPWDSPGKNSGVGCHALLQGTFPGIEPESHMSRALAGGFFPTSITWEDLSSGQNGQKIKIMSLLLATDYASGTVLSDVQG